MNDSQCKEHSLDWIGFRFSANFKFNSVLILEIKDWLNETNVKCFEKNLFKRISEGVIWFSFHCFICFICFVTKCLNLRQNVLSLFGNSLNIGNEIMDWKTMSYTIIEILFNRNIYTYNKTINNWFSRIIYCVIRKYTKGKALLNIANGY